MEVHDDCCNDMCENSGPTAFMRGSKRIGYDRRKEILDLAAVAADWIVEKRIKPHELRLFRLFVEGIVNVEDR